MSTGHDSARISRRVVLGAAAPAGATLGGAGHAFARAPSSSDASGPTNDPYFVAESTDPFRRSAPAPTTPGTRYVSLAGTGVQADLQHRCVLAPPPGAFGSQLRNRQPTRLHGGCRAATWCPDHRDGQLHHVPHSDSLVVRLVCHRSSVASTSAVFNVATLDTSALA